MGRPAAYLGWVKEPAAVYTCRWWIAGGEKGVRQCANQKLDTLQMEMQCPCCREAGWGKRTLSQAGKSQCIAAQQSCSARLGNGCASARIVAAAHRHVFVRAILLAVLIQTIKVNYAAIIRRRM